MRFVSALVAVDLVSFFIFQLATSSAWLVPSQSYMPRASTNVYATSKSSSNRPVVDSIQSTVVDVRRSEIPKPPSSSNNVFERRQLFQCCTLVASAVGAILYNPEASNALVKGVSPPTKTSAISGKPKCTNVEECQALAEQREAELRQSQEQGPPPKTTASGVRYIDLQDGSGREIKDGDEVKLYFKVLKLGKRSYDGLSGEGTEVFSRGYGLEDDEEKPKQKSFDTVVGSYSTIQALNDALVGMKVGGIRRFSIVPQKGWQRPTVACDGGPGGRGAGGDLRTDYVVVPTATMVDQEACFDKSKQPFPFTYAQQRRMAQRFDQSLIMEVEVANIL